MKVTHICHSGWKGGAARSAARLHTGLRVLGVDSKFVVQESTPGLEAVEEVGPPPPVRGWLWRFFENHGIHGNRTPLSNSFFSAPVPGGDVPSTRAIREAGVIHLHWVAHQLTPASFAKLAQSPRPIVWTLHDQRAFTGGCHFSAGCLGFETSCAPCPQLRDDPCHVPSRVLAQQRTALPPGRVVIASPSRWLADCARRSALFAGSRIEVIPYGVDTDAFAPMDRAAARAELGLPPDGFQILFGADHGMEKRKGAAELAAALRELAREPGSLRLLCFGRPAEILESTGLPLHSLGYLEGDAALRRAYSAANVFVLPSLEDNLPNTMLETLACGTPVAGFAIGGLPDVVVDGKNGRLARGCDPMALAAALRDLAADPRRCAEMGTEGASMMRERFQLHHQAERYRDLYATLESPDPALVARAAHPVPGPLAAAALMTLARCAVSRFTGAKA